MASRSTDRPDNTPQDELQVASTLELAWERARVTIFLLLLVILLLLAFWFREVFIFIFPGESGVRWRRLGGGTELSTYGEGVHAIWPWDRMYIYDVRVQEISISTTIYAEDGLEINALASVRYRPRVDNLSRLHQNIGQDYVAKIVEPEIVSTLRKVLGNFTPNDIYARDEQGLLAELGETMEEDFESEYVTLEKLLIQELRLPEHIQAAIQDKLEQEQRAQAYYFILEREEYEHQRRIIEATGIRDFEEISGVPILRWRGLDVTEALATSPNSKVVIAGTGADQLPIILNTEDSAPRPPASAPSASPRPSRPGDSGALRGAAASTPSEAEPPSEEPLPEKAEGQ